MLTPSYPSWTCPNCAFSANLESDATCFVCHQPRPAENAPSDVRAAARPTSGRTLAVLTASLLVIGGGTAAAILYRANPSGASPQIQEVAGGQSSAAPASTPTSSDAPGTYTVRVGDTLYGIAVLLGVTEPQLRWWNLEKYPSLRTNPRNLIAGWVLITAGEPMPTPTPRPTPLPTAQPTQGPIAQPGGGTGGSSSDWTYAAYLTALAWRTEALATYSEVGYNASILANATVGSPGTSPEERAAWIAEAELFYIKPSYAALDAHMAWLNANPAANCFRDAYQADLNLAAVYRGWLQGWFPAGGSNSPEGRAQTYALDEIERSRDALVYTDWFSDCG